MGDDYQPSDRVAAALTELTAALQEDESEVRGFNNFEEVKVTRTLSFDSLLPVGSRYITVDPKTGDTKGGKWKI